MAYEMTGTAVAVMGKQTFPSGFSKREFVIENGDKYPQQIKFECHKDKADVLDGVRQGDTLAVTFDIQGREYNGKYYVTLVAWKVVNQSDVVDTEQPDNDLYDNTGATEPDQSTMPF